MAKATKSTISQSFSLLTVSKENFKKELQERIEIGEELHKRPISNTQEFDKYKSDYGMWNDYNSEYLKQSFNATDSDYKKSYDDAGYHFMGQMGEVPNNPVLSKRNLINYKLQELRSLLAKSNLLKSEKQEIESDYSKPTNRAIVKTDVFIVHGHDDLAKVQAARFIEQLGLKPIILHEQSSSGRTIIEKIEEYSNVGFGIILYTQCDVGAKKGDEGSLRFRARQNVVFEHGYLIGKIGRSNVCALVKNEVETPNDISGVVYVNMDADNAWHLKIAKELRSSGYNIDMNKL